MIRNDLGGYIIMSSIISILPTLAIMMISDYWIQLLIPLSLWIIGFIIVRTSPDLPAIQNKEKV